MKGLKLIFAVLKLILISEFSITGQTLGSEYLTVIGLRAVETSGIIFKANPIQAEGLEFIAEIGSNWLSLTALDAKSSPAFNINGLKRYYGGVGYQPFGERTYYIEISTNGNSYFGFDPGLGIKFKI
jgi:hypothetical protein